MVSQLRPIRMQSNPDLKKTAITIIFLPEPLDLKFIFKWNINVVISLIKIAYYILLKITMRQ